MGITPTSFSTSTVSTITIASHGQPSRKHPSGPLLMHFLHPIQRIGSIWILPNGGWSSSGTQNMQSSTGQYSTQAGEPAHPVQHSVMTANSFGFFFRGVNSPFDLGSNLSSSGTIPAGFNESASAGMAQIIPQGMRVSCTPKDNRQPKLRPKLEMKSWNNTCGRILGLIAIWQEKHVALL
jgi:hypothetical protein